MENKIKRNNEGGEKTKVRKWKVKEKENIIEIRKGKHKNCKETRKKKKDRESGKKERLKV